MIIDNVNPKKLREKRFPVHFDNHKFCMNYPWLIPGLLSIQSWFEMYQGSIQLSFLLKIGHLWDQFLTPIEIIFSSSEVLFKVQSKGGSKR
jgi:hypothetical protein